MRFNIEFEKISIGETEFWQEIIPRIKHELEKLGHKSVDIHPEESLSGNSVIVGIIIPDPDNLGRDKINEDLNKVFETLNGYSVLFS